MHCGLDSDDMEAASRENPAADLNLPDTALETLGGDARIALNSRERD
jgi:hypothetical protein